MHEDNVKVEPLRVLDYKEIHEAMIAGIQQVNGNQPGDPRRATELIVDVIRQEGTAVGKEIPYRLPLGPVGLEQLRNKCLATLKILEEWETQIIEH